MCTKFHQDIVVVVSDRETNLRCNRRRHGYTDKRTVLVRFLFVGSEMCPKMRSKLLDKVNIPYTRA